MKIFRSFIEPYTYYYYYGIDEPLLFVSVGNPSAYDYKTVMYEYLEIVEKTVQTLYRVINIYNTKFNNNII